MVHDNRDVWIIIPVYNEASVIAAVVERVLAVFPNVVCVDDGSTDGSAEVIAGTAAHLVRHPINLGQGAALQTGLRYALTHGSGAYFATFDADGQHRVEDVLAMLELARSGEADVVLGSRFLRDAGTGDRDGAAGGSGDGAGGGGVPRHKRIVLRTVALLSPTSRRLRLTDAHNGLRLFTRQAAADLKITQNGMAHASEIAGWLAHSSWRVREAPVTVLYTEYSRAKGQSLINGVNILFDVSVSRRGR